MATAAMAETIPTAAMAETIPTAAAAIRLYVGGLGERVTEEDIKNTFNNLGCVQSVDLIRTKGRGFAYINFFPSSLNSLPKLFSTYNGCSWKGGKLKLEKAKEHYLDRLKREWAEEAELKKNEHISHSDADASIVDSSDPQSTLDLQNMEFRLFFPKLRKMKPLPLSGTGKHKYSFRRLDGPPCPVHFCDCPEHSVPNQPHTETRTNGSDIRKGRINKKEYTMANSVLNRFSDRENNFREANIHDSVIQDDGVNEEEIKMMDSVMKKLLDKGMASSKNDWKNLNTSQKKTIPTLKMQEEANDIDKGTADDDKNVNAVAEDDGTSFPNEETLLDEETNDDEDDDDDDDDIQINVVAGRKKARTSLSNENERRNQDDLTRQNKPGFADQKVETSDRKRKSMSIDTNANDWAYTMHEKILVEPKPLPKRASTNGMWSQKSAWKQLIGDGSSSSFTLSLITPPVDTNHEACPKLRNKLPSDNKKSKKARRVALATPAGSKKVEVQTGLSAPHNKKSEQSDRVMPEEPEPNAEISTESKEDERISYCIQMGQLAQHDEKDELPVAQIIGSATGSDSKNPPKPGSKVSSDIKKSKKVRKVVPQTPIDIEVDEGVNNFKETSQSIQHEEKEGPPTGSDKAPRGSSWLQKSSWTQLVGGSNDSAFSISQILPGNLLQRENSDKPDDICTFSSISTGAFFEQQRTSERESDGSTSTVKKDDQVASATRDVEVGKASRRGVEISKDCPFMRNADSMKEWRSAKTATDNSLKKLKK
ncbi:hypothetical protein KSS87_008594 [Heliosperma pusillum]|nr:hypothetical protein KSS87_008594 [Heliosperma pusillum]